MAARAEAEAFEKEIRTSLLGVRQGYSTEVAEELVRNRNEVNQLKEEIARLKEGFQGELNAANAYHELAKTFKTELAGEKAKSRVLAEQVRVLQEQNEERDPIEDEAQRIQNRRYNVVVTYASAFLKKSFLNYNPGALKDFKDMLVRFLDNLLGKVLRELADHVTSETDRVLEVPDIEEIKNELQKSANEDDEGSWMKFTLEEQERTLRDLEERRVQSQQALEDAKEVARKAQMDLDKAELAVLQAGGTTRATEAAEDAPELNEERNKEEAHEELEEGEIREKAGEENKENDREEEEEEEKGEEEEEKPDNSTRDKKDDDAGKDNDEEDNDDDDKGGSAGAVLEQPEKDKEPEEPESGNKGTEEKQEDPGQTDEGDGKHKDQELAKNAKAKEEGEVQKRKVWTQSPKDKAEFSKRLEAVVADVTKRTTEVKNVLKHLRETVIERSERAAEEERNIQRDENGEVLLDYNDPNDI